MNTALNVITIVSSVLLIIFVLLQQRGSGLGGAFGGGSEVYQTKRGIERGVFIATIIVGIIFAVSSFVRFLVASS